VANNRLGKRAKATDYSREKGVGERVEGKGEKRNVKKKGASSFLKGRTKQVLRTVRMSIIVAHGWDQVHLGT